ncbi:MAG: WD40 repeat domain-containing protein, partial [Hymenobacteraceae bacterium]|nr:WD40 repeat domain-containing protein [Hymenobacteraceae bacterium]
MMSVLPFAITRRAVLRGHRDCVYALAPGAPSQLFSAGADGLVVAWDLAAPDPDATGTLVAQVEGSVYAVRWRAATNHLLIGHNRQGLHVVDLASRQLVRAPALGAAPIFELALSEPIGRAWAALGDGRLAELDLATYAVRRTVQVSAASLRTVAVATTRGELVVAGSDHRVRVLDVDSLHVKHELIAHTNSVFTAAFSPDEGSLITAGRDAQLRFWEASAGYAPGLSVVAHLFAINHAAFSPDGVLVGTASLDKSIKLWSARTGGLLQGLDRG